eukprot:Rmarinus@m.1251
MSTHVKDPFTPVVPCFISLWFAIALHYHVTVSGTIGIDNHVVVFFVHCLTYSHFLKNFCAAPYPQRSRSRQKPVLATILVCSVRGSTILVAVDSNEFSALSGGVRCRAHQT